MPCPYCNHKITYLECGHVEYHSGKAEWFGDKLRIDITEVKDSTHWFRCPHCWMPFSTKACEDGKYVHEGLFDE